MITPPGPRCLVLIRAGRYDYAEVVLGNSTHLVGKNNVGKTSLIATLQFLYVASYSEMKFSRPWDESLRYYFHDETSTILFEIATADGRLVTFGLRGRGQLSDFQVERFAFEGPYKKADFLTDDNCVRQFSEVKARLASERYFKLLEPSDIRAAVVGDYTDVPALNLGIVPLRNTERYGDFVYLLKNLLRLSSLSQNDIKDTLLNVYRHSIQTVEIDLYGTYAELLSGLNSERVKLTSLHKVAVLTTGLKSKLEERSSARRDLPAMYAAVVAAKARAQSELERSHSDLQSGLTKLEAMDRSANDRNEALESENNKITGDLALTMDWIQKFEAEQVALHNYLPQIEEQKLENLNARIESLATKIAQAGDPVEIERTLANLKINLRTTTEQRDKHAKLLGTRLQDHLGTGAVADLGRIFHPAFLRLPIESGSIEITDEELLVTILKNIGLHVVDGHLRVAGVDVMLDRIGEAHSLAVADVATLNAEIEVLERKISETTDALDIARNLLTMKAERAELSKEMTAAIALASRFTAWRQNVVLLKEKQSESKRLQQEKQKNLDSRKKLEIEGKDRVQERIRIQNSIGELEARRKNLDGIRPAPIDSTWPIGTTDAEWLTLGARELNDLYSNTYTRYLEADVKIASVLEQAELVYQDGFQGADQDERISALIEAVESLGDHEKSFREQLNYVITGMRASFSNMFKSYNELSECVNDFSRSIGKISISNLAQLSLELYENKELTQHYRSISTSDLLDEPEKAEVAIEFIANTIEKTRMLHLSDWFGVRFIVTTANGETRDYDDLTVIESNGTTIAIKILVNIVLMRAMMRKNKSFSIPFYVDEATQIDEANLKEIIELANSKGFCPVLASTMPAAVAEHTDFVRRMSNDRAVIDPKWRITREAKIANARAT